MNPDLPEPELHELNAPAPLVLTLFNRPIAVVLPWSDYEPMMRRLDELERRVARTPRPTPVTLPVSDDLARPVR